MFLKFMGAMPGYIFAQDDAGLYVNLFVGSRAKVRLAGTSVAIRQKTQYPWQGDVRIAVDPERPAEFDLRIRIPGWCRTASSPGDLYQSAGVPAVRHDQTEWRAGRESPDRSRLRRAASHVEAGRPGRADAAHAGAPGQGPSGRQGRRRPRRLDARADRLLRRVDR